MSSCSPPSSPSFPLPSSPLPLPLPSFPVPHQLPLPLFCISPLLPHLSLSLSSSSALPPFPSHFRSPFPSLFHFHSPFPAPLPSSLRLSFLSLENQWRRRIV